jgi:hypothetical protein
VFGFVSELLRDRVGNGTQLTEARVAVKVRGRNVLAVHVQPLHTNCNALSCHHHKRRLVVITWLRVADLLLLLMCRCSIVEISSTVDDYRWRCHATAPARSRTIALRQALSRLFAHHQQFRQATPHFARATFDIAMIVLQHITAEAPDVEPYLCSVGALLFLGPAARPAPACCGCKQRANLLHLRQHFMLSACWAGGCADP